jgi:DNA processing protein
MATGIDQVYPTWNRDLARDIVARGALLTEFPVGAPPLQFHFPQRNRIISGLTVGTVVVEAAERSGSLITAEYAVEQGREVFAVPGPIGTSAHGGSHA